MDSHSLWGIYHQALNLLIPLAFKLRSIWIISYKRRLNISCQKCLSPKRWKMYSILVTLWNIQPHYSQSSHDNVTPSSGTSPSAYYKEVPPSPSRLLPSNQWWKTFFQALVSHDSKLPDDVITPVLPPVLPSPSFPLPRMQRVQRGGSLENPSTSQGAVSTPTHFN